MKLFFRRAALGAIPSAAVIAAACGSSDIPGPGITYTDLYLDPSTFHGSVACGEGAGTMRSYVVTLFDVTAQVMGAGGAAGASAAGASGAAGVGGASGAGVAGASSTGGATSAGAGGSSSGGGAGGASSTGPASCPANGAADGFRLPSSAPTPCTLRSLSGAVVPTHSYVAAVDAYALAPCDATHVTQCIRPLAPGSPIMVDDGGQKVAPLAATCCGTAVDGTPATPNGGVLALTNGPTTAVAVSQVPIRGCAPLVAPPAPPSSVMLDTAAVLGGLSCGAGPSAIDHLTVSTAGTPPVVAPCGTAVTLAASPGQELAISVYGYAQGAASPGWGAMCFATPLAGASAKASCDPLSSMGTLRIAPSAALATAGVACASVDECLSGGPTTGACTVEASGPGVPPIKVACRAPLLAIPNLSSGVHTVALVARDASGAILPGGKASGPTAICSGSVAPGHFVDATCSGG